MFHISAIFIQVWSGLRRLKQLPVFLQIHTFVCQISSLMQTWLCVCVCGGGLKAYDLFVTWDFNKDKIKFPLWSEVDHSAVTWHLNLTLCSSWREGQNEVEGFHCLCCFFHRFRIRVSPDTELAGLSSSNGIWLGRHLWPSETKQ